MFSGDVFFDFFFNVRADAACRTQRGTSTVERSICVYSKGGSFAAMNVLPPFDIDGVFDTWSLERCEINKLSQQVKRELEAPKIK